MKEVILIKNGELSLKGLNRAIFEDKMVNAIKRRLKPLGNVKITRSQSTVFIEPIDPDFDVDEALERISYVFGIAAYSRAGECEKDIDKILKFAPVYLKDTMENIRTFKVEAKRADKSFPLKSPEISAAVGGALLSRFPHLRVDVHSPDEVITVEIRDKAAYIRGGQIKGAGGLPTGTAGKAQVLISGGIDSPVAAYLMAKRGLTLNAVHFASPPYTSERAEQKVKDLLSCVAKYSGPIYLAVVPFTEIQEEMAKKCPEDFFTLVMRRIMMRIACIISREQGCEALITGESLGQVASQTLQAIAATDSVCDMPVMRPLIGSDKEEIVKISKKIGAFDISILPYEDCCTVFTPKHPHTRPKPGQCEKAEEKLDIENLIKRAIENTKYYYINN
ncbi:MAG: tRNA 4-thiouridine(8) synthase ThiI [Clostridia bacterium]|nr:tRNA 4-thiouridine(8) synthase ThiI [Clostridia bacterium]